MNVHTHANTHTYPLFNWLWRIYIRMYIDMGVIYIWYKQNSLHTHCSLYCCQIPTRNSKSFWKRKSGDFPILLVLKNRYFCSTNCFAALFSKNILVPIDCSVLVFFIGSFIDLGFNIHMYITTAYPTWGDLEFVCDFFECWFKAQRSKLERLLCHVAVKRDVRALSFELSKMSLQVGMVVPHIGCTTYRMRGVLAFEYS